MIRVNRLIMALTVLLSAPAFSEPLSLGEGLIIEAPASEDFVFQTIPSYDASKKMLVHHSDQRLQYFISINRLPRGSVDSEQYFTRLIRDLDAASVKDSVEIIDQGQYRSNTGLAASYLEYSFVPNGSNRTQHQIAHFMTNSSRTFVAIAVLVDEQALEQMRNNSWAVFKTASISLSNTPLVNSGAINSGTVNSGVSSGIDSEPQAKSASQTSSDADRGSSTTDQLKL